MSSIQQIQEEIVEEFEMFDDWMQRYEYMIELGKTLPLIDEKYKTEEYIIKGCQSKVWVHADMEEGKVAFTADSDAIITKGIIAILIRTFSGQPPKEILDADTAFIDKIGLKEHLSPTRANGLVSMIKQIKLYAIAYQTQLD
ncbi:MAG: SufE family protein [Leeuwenhoekiella sp.]